jgi:hypothetical protein
VTRRLIIRPEAEADLTDTALWYDSREPGLGLELVSEVNAAILRALTNPESFTRIVETRKFVVFSLDSFPIVFSLLLGLMQ